MNMILGGTTGLGHEIAKDVQSRGEETFVVGRSYNQAAHGNGMAIDLAKTEQVERLVGFVNNLGDTAIRRFFWVSGYGYQGNFADQPSPDTMAAVNFANVMPVTQAIWRSMAADQQPSNFVIVSSTSGVRARSNEAVYAASKHALVGFGRSLGLESERLGLAVRVGLFLPGGYANTVLG